MKPRVPIERRVRCLCCGYPTLEEVAANEICELCNWEDDGQGEDEANEVWGGPNSDYSLAEARANFKRFRVMYAAGRDPRITPGDSPLEYETKGLLMEAFDKLAYVPVEDRVDLESEIDHLEQVLQGEIHRKVREYEERHRGEL